MIEKKKPRTDTQMLELQNLIIEALQDLLKNHIDSLQKLLKDQVTKYNDLVKAVTNPKVVVKKPLYVDVKTIMDHGSNTLKSKFKEHLNKTYSIEEILMDKTVSRQQIIEVMYDALNIMQGYNGNTVAHCLIEAIKSSDIIYEK